MGSKRKHEDAFATGLCSTCTSMTSTVEGLQALASKEGYQHLQKKMITKSAKRGCSLCAILRSYRGKADSDGCTRLFVQLEHYSTDGKDSNIKHPFSGHRIKRLLVNVPPGWFTFGYELCAFTTLRDPGAQYLDIQLESVQVMSSTIVRHAQELLENCQKEHKYCPSASMPNLPKRVLDVGKDESNLSVRIHVSEPNEQAFYIALSYCWGGTQDIMTTSATLQSYMKSLPSELPQTIQDAILVTRRLGFRYLWIDALCIIQDDVVDKSVEVNNMGMIYRSATLTIAAASASSVKEGFLQDRSLPSMCQLPFYINDEREGSIWLRNPDKVHPEEPLDQRAWTLQESILSPRILYYATRDLIWKCATQSFIPVKETHNPYYAESTRSLPYLMFRNPEMARSTSQLKAWRKIIVDYSRRKLSVAEDRLPALAGLAGEFHKVWPDKYVAGMWQGCLIKHLGWWRPGSVNKTPRMSHKSPTWSWTSHDGFAILSDIHHTEAELLDVSVTLVDKNVPFGQVSSGRLVLRAPVLPGDTEMELGAWLMDYDPYDLNMVHSDTRFLLLGYSAAARNPIALILSPLGDGTFGRSGLVMGWHLKGATPWSTDQVRKETLIVI